jgi:hypothetical protein
MRENKNEKLELSTIVFTKSITKYLQQKTSQKFLIQTIWDYVNVGSPIQ